ncbi:MAG: Coenzyme F420 hydrogenase/dehydrogenase, beta subunit C-terminal domain [Candidatus Jordarchaeales archaeon]
MCVGMKGNICFVVESGLCAGCGTCYSFCPNNAIRIIKNSKNGFLIATVDEKKCSKCGICVEVCPGFSFDFEKTRRELFKENKVNFFVGPYLNAYLGYSTDHDIRYMSSSGGLVTALLLFALEEGLIDGAIVTKMEGLEATPIIAENNEEIIAASGSKYCPVPLNIALKRVLETEKGKKFAIVGLPCHIHGVRKAEKNKELKEKIAFLLGLFCGGAPTFSGTEFLFSLLGIKKSDVTSISYRGCGWPGYIQIKTKNNKNLRIGHLWSWRIFGIRFFATPRCMVCCDATSEFADLSFGDAWLPRIMESDRVGTSIVLSRTDRGEDLLSLALKNRKIELSPLQLKEVIESQKGTLLFKKKFEARARLFKDLYRMPPFFNSGSLKLKFGDYLLNCIYYFNFKISRLRFLWRIIPYLAEVENKLGYKLGRMLVHI